ncbi:hypothetical protein [Rhizobium sp. MHM7A]|uniref:hypothetical protein n=1 Tax=Rhizobium sp. MHM7A TaxID=2583233 RepID=UPI001105EC50|nr:hypothetical protein [Rhizobium sp. MHM7A]TLX16447.1 hypothetical protein FFR93_03680 [Rhizobium sp. MHM7A]
MRLARSHTVVEVHFRQTLNELRLLHAFKFELTGKDIFEITFEKVLLRLGQCDLLFLHRRSPKVVSLSLLDHSKRIVSGLCPGEGFMLSIFADECEAPWCHPCFADLLITQGAE